MRNDRASLHETPAMVRRLTYLRQKIASRVGIRTKKRSGGSAGPFMPELSANLPRALNEPLISRLAEWCWFPLPTELVQRVLPNRELLRRRYRFFPYSRPL